MKSFLKWAGGKRQLLSEIEKRLPSKIQNYYEPFLGGGSLFFHLEPTSAFISDTNIDLINCYRVVKYRVEELIDELDGYENTPECYDRVRSMDKSPHFSTLSNVTKAARFIFLNRTCYNGLYRVNKNGQFNTPYGKYKKSQPWDYDVLRNCSLVLQDAMVFYQNFDQVLFDIVNQPIVEHNFVYFDPPYLPISQTSNFTSYTAYSFTLEDHKQLKQLVDKLTEMRVKCMVSNSDHPDIRNLYQSYNVDVVKAKRNINCNPSLRGKINELIITNY